MQSVQFSAAQLAALVNSATSAQASSAGTNAADKKTTDQFSSLLDIVGGNDDDHTNSDSNQKDNKKDDTNTPVAAIVAAPVDYADARPLQPATDSDSYSSDTKTTTQDHGDNGTSSLRGADNAAPKYTAAKNTNAGTAANTSAASSTKTDSATTTSAAKTTTAATDDDATDETTGNDSLQKKIVGSANQLGGLLSLIANFLTQSGAKTATVTGANNGTAVATGAVDASMLANVQQQTAQATGVATPVDTKAVLSDTQNVLQQIQSLLATANAQNAPLSADAIAKLQKLDDQLALDLKALQTAATTAQTATDSDASALTQPAAAGATDTFTAVKNLIKNNLALLTDTQKIADTANANNAPQPAVKALLSAIASQPKTNAQTDTTLSATAAQNTSKAAVANAQDVNVTVNATAQTVQVSASTALPVQPIVLKNDGAQTQTILAAAVQAATNNANTDSNSSNNSNQNQPQPQMAIGNVAPTTANAANNAGGATFSSLLNRASQTPVSEQVAFQIKNNVSDGSSKIHIQLDPTELGKVEIKLSTDSQGKTGVTVTADNKSTLDLLQRDASGLQKALSDAGLKTDSGSLSFNLRGGQQEGQGQSREQAAATYRKSQPEEDVAPIAVVTRSYTVNVPDGLDIKI